LGWFVFGGGGGAGGLGGGVEGVFCNALSWFVGVALGRMGRGGLGGKFFISNLERFVGVKVCTVLWGAW